jgi:4-cresol dehydrogenase (hydroxylating)
MRPEGQVPAFAEAIHRWTAIVGAEHVVCDREALAAASTATFRTTSRVIAVVRPGSREDVQACVCVAGRFGVPVYPISSGKNWGYGSRVPVRDGVLLDLGRMNRIVDFNEDLAYVTIEPGVTQRQLFSYLSDRGGRLWMDATGASPDCSIIGNTLDRGFGHTPMGDHCANASGLEVVLPNGELLETGYGRFPAAPAGVLGRWGVGPSIDGLFSQSNLGIVTRMSVWLMPAPEHFEAFFFLTNDPDGLAPIVEALRPLRLNGTLRSVAHLGNDYKVLAGSSQFPWNEVSGRLDAQAMRRLRKLRSIGCWNGSGGLYGTRAQVKDAKRQLKRALAGKVDRLQFVNDRLLGIMDRYATPFRLLTGWDVRTTLSVLAPVYGLLKGVPTDAPLSSVYWRKKTPVPADRNPDRDSCGLLWCSPVLPSTGADAAAVTALATGIVGRFGFEPQMSLSLATERSSVCVITIAYDREVAGEDGRASDCYHALTRELVARGYPPYRLNVGAMDLLEDGSSHAEVVRAIKLAIDPQGIVAPGRYDSGAVSEAAAARTAGVA